MVSDDVQNQTYQALSNVGDLLRVAGSGFDKLLQCRVFLVDINDYQSMNKIYASFFTSAEQYPARTALAVKALPIGAKVEIECTAYVIPTTNNVTPRNGHTFSLALSNSFIVLYTVISFAPRFTF